MFARGGDGQLWHLWWDGTAWSSWEPLGGQLQGAPTVASWASNRLDVFVRGTDDQLWHQWWDGVQWTGYEPLGGVLVGAPAAVSWGPGRIDVVVRGTDDHAWHQWYADGQWWPWEDQGGVLRGDPAVASWGPDRLDVLAIGTDAHLWTKSYEVLPAGFFGGHGPGWNDWYQLAFQPDSDPGAAGWLGAARVDVFAIHAVARVPEVGWFTGVRVVAES